MKKLLSIILALALMLSFCTICVSAEESELVINKKAKTDIAATGALELYFSNLPYEDVYPEYGYVLGYIGDADFDDEITITDATEIQRHCAGITEFDVETFELADVDFDWEVSVIDATEIQRYVAGISESEFIAHTLFYNDTAYLTHDEIAQFVMDYGEFYEDSEGYSDYDYYSYSFTDEESGADLYIDYYPNIDGLDFMIESMSDSDICYYTYIETYKGESTFHYYSDAYGLDGYDEYYFAASGEASITDMSDGYTYDMSNETFVSDIGMTYEDVEDLIQSSITMCIDATDVHLWDYINGYVADLFF